jgi:hypothetical protein
MDELVEWDSDKPKPHRLEAFLNYFDPDNKRQSLTPNQTERLELMRETRHWRQNFFSPNQVVKMLQDKKQLSQSQSYQILKDADYIFGKIELINKEAERSIQIETFHKAIQLVMACNETSKFEKGLAIAKINKDLVDLTGTRDISVNMDPMLMMAPVQINIQIDSNPNEREIIDIPHEPEH